MDPISAALNIIGVVSKIKDMIDKVSENREMCRKLCGRLEVLSYLFAKANSDLMQQPETKRIVFQVNEFIENAHQFIIQLLPRANRRGKRSMVSKLQTRVSEIRSFIKAAKKSKTNGAKLAEMFETLNFFVLTLSPMLLLYNSQKQSTNSPALVLEATKAAEILQAFAVDIRNTLIKSVNTMMMEAHCGAALPEDIDILPSCVEEVNAAILELAATLGVHSVELPPLAASAAQTKLKSFVEKKVVEIRFVSQSMAGKAAAVSASFPDDDQDISVCFESCGGLNDDRLGKVGGFGVTYKRRYKPTGKVYALKEVNVGFASSRGLTEDRLLMEVETLQVICHPNIVRCHHSYFSDDGLRFYLVMELVDGQTFDQVLRSQSYNPDPEKLVKWLKQLASALVYMHEDCNIVHRDLKPENVMVTRGMGDIKLIDFGMARFMPASLSDPASITMTAAIGTQFYMSYAKKNGEMYDGRDDVWAVGCIILEMLLGISVVSQKALCDEDTMRASLLQEAKQRHGGIGALLETVLGSKLNGTIPYAAVLLIMASDVQVLSSSAVESVADSFNKLPGAKPTLSESSTSKAGAKTELVQWLLSNVPGFTDKDAVDCADNCVEIGCNTIDLVCEEFVMRMSESESVADELVGLLVSSVPLRRRLRQTLWTHTSTRATPLPAMASAPPASTGGVISEDIGNPPVSTPACTSSPSAIRATEEDAIVLYSQGKALYDVEDYTKAEDLLARAATLGHASAQKWLGSCYDRRQDYKQAVHWYTRSAVQGCDTAQFNLGVCYESGRGVSRDLSQAVYWYKKAAAQGLAYAQFNLGTCYSNALGVVRDYTKAIEWYTKAAEQGQVNAQYNLANCYYSGHGVVQDRGKAVEWFHKAADQGNVNAQFNLGRCFREGEGVPKNLVEARRYYAKAAAQGDEGAARALLTLK